MRISITISTVLTAGLLLTACGGGTTPLIDYCCVDTLVHNDEGQDLTGLQKRGTVSMVWNQSLIGDSVTSRFTLDALFLDYISNQDSVSGGTIELSGVPEGGDVYGVVSVSGNEAERIPSFSSSMYVPPPLVMYLEDDNPRTGPGEIATDGSLLIRWEPSSFAESKVRLVLRSRNQDDLENPPVELLFTLDDTGSYEFSREALEELDDGHQLIDIIAFRSYKKCTCQNIEPYLLRTSSYFNATFVRLTN